jgi:hypothetical protein
VVPIAILQSQRGMHEWWAKRLQDVGVDHFPMHEIRHMHLDREDLEEAMRLAYLRWLELGVDEKAD